MPFFTYRYPNQILPDPAREQLTALEDELERSILVINAGGDPSGSYSNHVADPLLMASFWREAEQYHGTIDNDIKENALILLLWASLSRSDWAWLEDDMPDEWFVERNTSGWAYPGHDFIQARDTDNGDYVTIGGHAVIEMRPNIVAVGLDFRTWQDSYPDLAAAFNWRAFLIEPLRTCSSESFIIEAAARQAERDRRAFTEFMSGAREQSVVAARQQMENFERQISTYTESLTRALAEARRNRVVYESAIAATSGESDRWTKMWDDLLNHSRLTSVRYSNNKLILTTDHLFITNPSDGARRWLGRVEISIENSVVRIHNLDNAKSDRAHPHVAGTVPCWGGISNTVAELLSQSEITAFLDLCLMYLETFNPADDWGNFAAYWFDVEDETPDFLKDNYDIAAEPVAEPVAA